MIAVDAGSVDAGPYYLGSGEAYMGEHAIRRDLQLLVEGAINQNCPLIIGSAGFSGSAPGLRSVVEIVKSILTEAGVKTSHARLLTLEIPVSI